jgi:thioredoxin 1
MGAVVQVTKENFDSLISGNKIVFLDFWAPWCGPCRSFAPTFEAAANKHPDIVFGKVNTEEEQELAAMFGIRSIPTLTVFKEDVGIFSQPGALPGTALDDLAQKVRDLDMDEVRKNLKNEGGNQ